MRQEKTTPGEGRKEEKGPAPRPRAARPFSVVVAIDFGTTSSGYAFSFTQDPETIHMMRRWEGGDPGVANQKSPTCLLLTPELRFHSFGPKVTGANVSSGLGLRSAAGGVYLNAAVTDPERVRVSVRAAAGLHSSVCVVVKPARRRVCAAQEVKDQSSSVLQENEVRWVITVPAVWRQPAKQFMREAAYLAGLVSPESPDQLLIALEPEAASIYCRKLRMHQVIDLSARPIANGMDIDGSRLFDSGFRQ
ncbi:hypothetical protein Z043_124929, partial [Scleropages formosus]